MKKFLIASSAFLPVFALAQTGVTVAGGGGDLVTISQVISRLQTIIGLIIPFLVGVAVLVVIYGIISFISNAADEEARANAKHFIIWGVIGIFMMLSVWGLVTILVNSFGTDASTSKLEAVNNVIPVAAPNPNY